MECAHVYMPCLLLSNNLSYAVLHLIGSLVGKSQCKNTPWRHTTVDEVCYLVCKHAGLSRPRTGNDKLCPVAIFHSGTLSLVKFIQQPAFISAAECCFFTIHFSILIFNRQPKNFNLKSSTFNLQSHLFCYCLHALDAWMTIYFVDVLKLYERYAVAFAECSARRRYFLFQL